MNTTGTVTRKCCGTMTPFSECLREMHQLYPDWRFGQMIANLATWVGKTQPGKRI